VGRVDLQLIIQANCVFTGIPIKWWPSPSQLFKCYWNVSSDIIYSPSWYLYQTR